ncbi:outer membrane beta-barrel protein [Flavihumibacter sp. UBA7668]|uniref:outer membrane beta-barrel protein n=1 Tax=Flavihumibacter sp. UBA7668 TaxID=1946542 RepID=UPI0025BF3BFA|nr:outer membrane beta-barrel protein [Flavihumibacter sp. UBA7668]
MKKMITCLAFSGIVFSANAQVPQGSLLVGGSLGLGSNTSSSGSGSNTSSSNFSIAPRISYAIATNTLLSFKTGFGFSQTEYYNGDKAKNNGFSLGLYAKKLIPIKNAFGWYPEVGASIAAGKNDYRNVIGEIVETNNREFTTGVTPGLYYQAGKKMLINVEFGGLQYQTSRSEDETNDRITKNRSLGLSLFQTFQLGFDFIIK